MSDDIEATKTCANCGADLKPEGMVSVCDESCLLAALEVRSWPDD